jgi:hypothetical protein
VDGLGAGYLGPYGNTWIDTSATNRLASQGLLVEHPLIDTPNLEKLYNSYWRGRHAVCPPADPGPSDLATCLRRSGIRTALVTDAADVHGHALAASFEDRLHVQPPARPDSAASVDQTQLACLFARAVEWLSEAAPPFLLWVHARAMNGPWDAPLDLRRQLADPDDPLPPDLVEVPRYSLPSDYDPDELLGLAFAYAAQVMAWDRCLGGLLHALDSLAQMEETLFCLTASKGFPLGEHRRIGPEGSCLYHELIHVPYLLRTPKADNASRRSQSLWQPHQLYRTLIGWFLDHDEPAWAASPAGRPPVGEPDEAGMQRACSVSALGAALRTPAWFLHTSHQGADRRIEQADPPASHRHQLFVKPDDRWDANDVASRCPGVVKEMHEQLMLFQQAAREDRLDRLPRLPDELLQCWQ